jgi:hypothetical protein
MKLTFLPWIIASIFVISLSSASLYYPSGSPAAKTGSPGDGASCAQCHGQAATTTAGLITSNIPAEGYTPGQTYQITANNTLTGSGKYGFEVSSQNATGTQLGTLAAGTGSKLVGGTKYVTQSNASSSTHTWTFNWTAPAVGTGPVTFYGAFARNYSGPTTLSTLIVQEAASAPAAAGPITGPASVCKNTIGTYSVAAIPGATGYTWSVPAGAIIQSGQGTLSISVSFPDAAASGNVSVFGTNTNGNGVPSNLAVAVNGIPQTSVPEGPALVDLHNGFVSTYTTTPGLGTYTWQLAPVSAGTIAGTTETATVTWNTGYTGYAEISAKAVNGCGEGTWSQVMTVQVINTTGMNENETRVRILASGNTGIVTLELNMEAPTADVKVLDLSGRVVLASSFPGKGSVTLPAPLSPGVYVMAVKSGNQTVKKKFAVVR